MTAASPLDREALDRHPLPPVVSGDKHDHGRLLIVAGSRTLAGAALLCAHGAMRAGAGKLQIATVESTAVQIAVAMPESRTIGMDECEDGSFATTAIDKICDLARDVDAVVAGPGMFATSACEALAGALLQGDAALAFDAGLLRSLAPHAEASNRATRLPVLLPHAGEMAALLDCDEQQVDKDPLGCGRRCSERYGAATLVKGATSHVVHPDGRAWTLEGNTPGLGVSGSGDTLAGIVGGLLARGAEPLTALLWGAWLHKQAGVALARRVGPIGFLARQIPDEIPALLAR